MKIQICPVCETRVLEGKFYVSRPVKNGETFERIYDVEFTPDVQHTRICQYAKEQGCLNTCKVINERELFENRNFGINSNVSDR